MTTCPDEATLRLIGTDAIGESTFAGLESHVEECSACQAFLEAERNKAARPEESPNAKDSPPRIPGFEIDGELGRGGAGVVYLARETALGRRVALKLFPRNSLVDPHAREHWLAEARALSRVPHERVVTIHHVIETNEWLCLVLEYVAGGTLKDRLTEPLAPRVAARLTESIARTLGYFHAHGVLHLDLKPANILLEARSEASEDALLPKIADFGLARLEGEPGTTLTGANGPKGTPAYMAPEQAAAVPGTIKASADLYGLGALMYHMLTGRPPFRGATVAETLAQVRREDPIPPRRLNGRIPRDLETICLTCLEKSPHRRYRSAEALADDLRLWLDGRPIKARRVSLLGHAWRLCLRHPAVASLLFLLTATVTAGIVGLFVLLNEVAVERAGLVEARRRAEAFERFSDQTTDELGDVLRITLRNSRNQTRDEMRATLSHLNDAIARLREAKVVSPASLGVLELELGWGFRSVDRIGEARSLLDQAIVDLKESLARNPDDAKARLNLGEAMNLSCRLAANLDDSENALHRLEPAVDFLLDSTPGTRRNNWLTEMYKHLIRIADRFRRDGRADLEQRSRLASRRILDHFVGSPSVGLAPDSAPGPETLPLLFRDIDFPPAAPDDADENRRQHDHFIAEWILLSTRGLDPFRSESAEAAFDRDPDARADALIGTIRDRCKRLGLDETLVPTAVRIVATEALGDASLHRKHKRHDQARAVARRLVTIGTRLVHEYPSVADSYWVLCQARDQEKKNAYESRDRELQQKSLILAIEAAERDVALDSQRLDSLQQLAKLTAQLSSLRAETQTAKASSR